MLIDVHAHFLTDRSGRADWREVNARRLRAGEKIGITVHVGSILGSWGHLSPTYFPSPDDLRYANESIVEMQRAMPGRVHGYCAVNPNYPTRANEELERGLDRGLVGIKLAASRRADDPLLDPIASMAAERGVPVLHHVWQHRRRDWPGQDASDAVELARLASRHPKANFILAHLGGGGEWAHSLRAVIEPRNVWVDLSGSGVDVGMLESALELLGAERLIWGTDLTMDTGWAKLRYLRALGCTQAELDLISYGNAQRIFPTGAFDVDH